MLRAIREIQPSYVVGENVRGLTNWNGGLVFDEVQADLEDEGYEVTPFLLPACAVNAPHRRDRIWFVAFNSKSKRDTTFRGIWERKDNESIGVCKENINASNSKFKGLQGCTDTGEVSIKEATLGGEGNKFTTKFASIDKESNASNSSCIELQGSKFNGSLESKRPFQRKSGQFSRPIFSRWQNFPTVSPLCDGDDGLSDRLDSITFSKWRNESIKAGGNAIVPQVVFQIFKSIEQYNQLNNQLTL